MRDPTGLVWIRFTGGSSSDLRVTAGVRGFPGAHISGSTLLDTGLRRVTVGVQLERGIRRDWCGSESRVALPRNCVFMIIHNGLKGLYEYS